MGVKSLFCFESPLSDCHETHVSVQMNFLFFFYFGKWWVGWFWQSLASYAFRIRYICLFYLLTIVVI